MTATDHPVLAELAEAVTPIMADAEVPGVSLAYRDPQGVIHATALGVRSVEHPEPLTVDDLHAIASITKPITATAVMRLAGAGRIDLDRALGEQLKAWEPSGPLAAVTPRHLLSHTSGFAGDYTPELDETADILDRYAALVSKLDAIHPPGELYSYSNGAFNVLGALVEHVTAQRFDRAMRDLVLDPAGMTAAAVYDVRTAMTYPVAQGHNPGDNGPEVTRPWGTDRLSWPCGGLATTMTDLLRFAGLHLDSDADVLDQASIDAMRTPVVRAAGGEFMGLGWFLDAQEEPRLAFHGGDGGGQVSDLWLAFAAGEAYAVSATNVPAGSLVLQAFGEVVRRRSGRPLAPRVPADWEPARVEPLIGTWTAPGTGDRLTVSRDGGSLVGQFTAGEQSITATEAADLPPIPVFTSADGLLVPRDPIWQQAFFEPVETSDGRLLLRVAQRLFVPAEAAA